MSKTTAPPKAIQVKPGVYRATSSTSIFISKKS
jgi:hypothetical protein